MSTGVFKLDQPVWRAMVALASRPRLTMDDLYDRNLTRADQFNEMIARGWVVFRHVSSDYEHTTVPALTSEWKNWWCVLTAEGKTAARDILLYASILEYLSNTARGGWTVNSVLRTGEAAGHVAAVPKTALDSHKQHGEPLIRTGIGGTFPVTMVTADHLLWLESAGFVQAFAVPKGKKVREEHAARGAEVPDNLYTDVQLNTGMREDPDGVRVKATARGQLYKTSRVNL